jgi:hypothetical protein
MSEEMPEDVQSIVKGLTKDEFKNLLKTSLSKKNPIQPVEQDLDDTQPFAAGDDHPVDDEKVLQDDASKKIPCG